MLNGRCGIRENRLCRLRLRCRGARRFRHHGRLRFGLTEAARNFAQSLTGLHGAALGGGAHAGGDIGQRHSTGRHFCFGGGAGRIGGDETRIGGAHDRFGEFHAGIGIVDRQMNFGAVVILVGAVDRRQGRGNRLAGAGLIAFDDLADGGQNFFHGRFTRYAWLSHFYPVIPKQRPDGVEHSSESPRP